ncbi:MAG: aconitate hydratase AcnA [Thermodesulfobacteriota bacterium]|nr:aconitate hydratase AcnA [Thermodesulfobacteriota bacterium]
MILPDCRQILNIGNEEYTIHNISILEEKCDADIKRLPFSIRILLENLLRNIDDNIVTGQDVLNVLQWGRHDKNKPILIPYHPARVLMQDFTGVPAVVDLAAMRDAVKDAGGDPEKINPLVPVDLVIDHSVQVDYHGSEDAVEKNVKKEYQRNSERYKLLKWAQKSFKNFRVVPPGSGICHQINLEYLSEVIKKDTKNDNRLLYPDTLVGTDSHTTMINGLGVLGWGVGGIEAEAVMLGQPCSMTLPEVVGVNLTGKPDSGVTATDIVLYITELLRKENVVEKFVEFTGPGMENLSLTDRATIANMAPEYGATVGFFPVDSKTLDYLKMTARDDTAELVKQYSRKCSLFYSGNDKVEFSKKIDIDLTLVKSCISGPSRPQDRIVLSNVKDAFLKEFQSGDGDAEKSSKFIKHEKITEPGTGSIVIAALTSCTNTSNPFVMIGAGLAAKNAVEKGLKVPWFVKTSLSPGSRVVGNYLEDAGLLHYLEELGFHIAGFGCMSCIGNSGSLDPKIEKSIIDNDLKVAAAVSGNRNFEARIHQSVKANYLMSPVLVVMYALAGRIDIDLDSEPVGYSDKGDPVFMKDIWPDSRDIEKLILNHVKPKFFKNQYSSIFQGDDYWQKLDVKESSTFLWDNDSLYIRKPSFFEDFSHKDFNIEDLKGARALLVLGDSVTTDHISPAGAIPKDYPAGRYLMDKGVEPENFNSYGSRRGNHEVMMRGTFGNIRIKNSLVSEQGSFTLKFPEKIISSVFKASMDYKKETVPLVVLGGKEYGTGSSRDWAAKGTLLLGVKAVIAESFERIHRSNLLGMGVLPLVLKGTSWDKLGLTGSELFEITGLSNMKPGSELIVNASREDGSVRKFCVKSRLDTDVELEYYKKGGILKYVLAKILKSS